ncbi:sensor histidine kinase [Cohnella lubricantis]|uniref:histidine kinase n=1 Tax=Cohnella lubricantis TaxID=2163172 RepID=A0A841TC27_9BACL|nr:sensor histidine kinase [Cohnella lubricantis]MBB6678562.1 sensor histidine kinase [Cohnella lubricantis]MBP2119129.1 signal transduction histidine kinase [Cohnella lubricantis]
MFHAPSYHWGLRALFYTRTIWVLLHLVLLGYEYPEPGWGRGGFLAFCLIAGAIPQLVWMREASRPSGSAWAYPVTELLCSGLVLVAGGSLIGQYFSYLAIPALCAAATVQSTRLRVPLWIWFSLAPPIAMAVVLPLASFNISIIEGFFFFALGVGIWKVIDTQRRMQLLLDENEEQRRVLEQYARQVETITLLEERNRLSRDLHDTVGHTLTSVIMGLDAVAYLIPRAPEEAAASVNQLRTVSRQGLEEMRRQVHHIAPEREGDALTVQLRRIASEFAVHTGATVEFEADGPDIAAPLPVTITLVRCLQEALTNAVRHGGASCIQIALKVRPELLELAIQDNGSGMDEVRYGFGLSAMQERIEAHQGELKVKSNRGEGTIVECRMPLKNRKVGSA